MDLTALLLDIRAKQQRQLKALESENEVLRELLALRQKRQMLMRLADLRASEQEAKVAA